MSQGRDDPAEPTSDGAPPEPPSAIAEPETITTEHTHRLDPAVVDAVETAIDEARLNTVEKIVTTLHTADLADLLTELHPDDRNTVVAVIRPTLRIDGEVLTYLTEEVRDDVLALLDPDEIAGALRELETDDALDLIADLEIDVRQSILSNLPVAARRLLQEGLSFPEYSAGRLMQREFVALPLFWTVGKAIDHLRQTDDLPDDFYQLYLVDPAFRPIVGLSLSRFLRSKRSVRLADLIADEEDLRTIPATLDQEEVALIFRRYGLVSAPVVDEADRLIGVITFDDVVEVIDEEAEDDLLKMGGVQEDDLGRAVWDTTLSRFPWLGVNLVTAIVASLVIALFDATLEQVVALAILMPIVASMGGNAGTQTLTVVVRGLATKELTGRRARRAVFKEIVVGLLNGLAFAVVGGLVAGLWFQDLVIGGIIALAMVITLLIAGLSGTLIPLALDRLKVDPAVASGVFLTTVTDVVGFMSFLGLATWLLL